MRKKNKFWVFVLLVTLMLSISSPVLAEDAGATGGALSGPEQTVTGEGIGNTTDPALEQPGSEPNEPTDPAQPSQDNSLKAKSPTAADRTVKSVSTTIPGFTVTGSPNNNFDIVQDATNTSIYRMYVTGGSISIEGRTTSEIYIEVNVYDEADVTLDGIEAQNVEFGVGNTDSGSVDLVMKGKNTFQSFNFYSNPITNSHLAARGIENASVITEALYFGGYSIDVRDISFISEFIGVLSNNLSFANVLFSIDYIEHFSVEKLSFIGCSGEFGFFKVLSNDSVFESSSVSPMISYKGDGIINTDSLHIKMDPDEQLKFTGVETPRNDTGVAAATTQIYPIAVTNNPTLENTTITTPTNGYFKSFQEEAPVRPTAVDSYFMVADASGNKAQNVVFTGNPAPEQPQKDFKQKVVKEPKTADGTSPWGLLTIAILSLITLAFVLKEKFVRVK